ncbi:unnamed protein product [Anisakis simplex]|uniref:Transmembrane protein n=1 Tax=Anisakis simplex TaxID=6269 RepID=A0A0M3JV14_ANISI|nr:unnamed protein product [Anisakis simplex]
MSRYVVLYFNYDGYGFTGDWEKYAESGTQIYFLIFNASIMFSELLVYAIILFKLITTEKVHAGVVIKRSSAANTTQETVRFSVHPSNQARKAIERSLLASCFISWSNFHQHSDISREDKRLFGDVLLLDWSDLVGSLPPVLELDSACRVISNPNIRPVFLCNGRRVDVEVKLSGKGIAQVPCESFFCDMKLIPRMERSSSEFGVQCSHKTILVRSI